MCLLGDGLSLGLAWVDLVDRVLGCGGWVIPDLSLLLLEPVVEVQLLLLLLLDELLLLLDDLLLLLDDLLLLLLVDSLLAQSLLVDGLLAEALLVDSLLAEALLVNGLLANILLLLLVDGSL